MNYKELIDLKNNICNEYLDHYCRNGFVKIPPLPLEYKKDITIDFTTCTICSAKENIRNKVTGEDYVMIQPALRNTHMDNLGKINTENYFFSFFSMMGGFKYYSDESAHINEFSQIIKNEFDFLKKYSQKVVLTIPIQYKNKLELNEETLEYLKRNNCVIKHSENDEENLKWKYGIANVVGYGTRWEVFNGGDLVNWGNTINVFVDGKEYGIDFGGGVESLIYSYLKLKSSIYANDGMTDLIKEFCNNDSIKEKIVDCIISSMCIITNKEKIILRDRFILETYINILHSYMVLNDIPKEKIMELVDDINNNNILYLNGENVHDTFEKYMDNAIKKHHIILKSKNIDIILKLMDKCYNKNDDNWRENKRIIHSHYFGYFANLSDVEILALSKSKKKYKE